jgi:hypothetical protein
VPDRGSRWCPTRAGYPDRCEAVAAVAAKLGLDPVIGYVEGDNLRPGWPNCAAGADPPTSTPVSRW